nr:putative ribonuclease h protein [Quercus suber]
MRWRIDDGSLVRIYQDRWLLGFDHDSITSPIVDITSDATVSILIDHDLCQWREDEVDRLFILEEASFIKAIPLSFSNERDMIFWPRSRDGVYSVKSGYKMLMELDNVIETATSVSSIDELKSMWNAIWSLQVPNRIRILVWQAGNDSLHKKVNLTRRKLLIEPTCTLCNQGTEDMLHALWTCPLLSMVSQVLFPNLVTASSSSLSFLSVMQLAQLNKMGFDLFAWMVSLIWLRRNKVRLGEDAVPLLRIPSMASDALQEFHQLRPIHAKLPRTSSEMASSTNRPSEGEL